MLLDDQTGAPIRPALKVVSYCSNTVHDIIDVWEPEQDPTTTDAASTTTTATPPAVAADGDVDGRYVGTVQLSTGNLPDMPSRRAG